MTDVVLPTGTAPVLQTANLQNDPEKEFALLDEFQPNRPNMVAEFWTGWFDHWMAPYHVVRSVERKPPPPF